MRYYKRFIRLSISQVVAFAIAAECFVYWAPWMASLTVAEASQRYPGQVDPSWRAVRVEHGRVSEWRLGAPRQNPVAFGLCTTALFSAVIYFIGTALWMEQHKKEAPHAA